MGITAPIDGLLWKFLGCDEQGRPRTSFIDDRMFRITQPSALNDPFEMKPKVLFGQYAPEDLDIARETARKAGMPAEIIEDEKEMEAMFLAPFPSGRFDEETFPGLWPARVPELREEPFQSIAELDKFHTQRVCDEVERVLDESIGVFSMTANPAQLLMWSHYGAGHKGIVVGLDPAHPFFRTVGTLHEVDYRHERVSVSTKHGVIRVEGHPLRDGRPPVSTIIRKGLDWKYESEFRFIVPLTQADEVRSGGNGEKIYLLRIPAEAIKAAVIGARVLDSHFAGFRRQVESTPGWSQIRLFRARLSERDFEIEFEAL